MNDLQIFIYQSNQVRTVQQDGEPWFVLKDVCDYFGVTNRNRAMQSIDEDEKGGTQMDTPGGKQNLTTINESGLYHLLFAIQPQKARGVSDEYIERRTKQIHDFQRWVTHEVLPSIRKHGMYATPDTVEKMLADPDTTIKLLQEIKSEREKRMELQAKSEADAPKVLFADAVSTSHTSILVGEMAKLIKQNGVDIGQNRLFEFLRSNGYLISRSGSDYNMPTQRSMERGWFKIKERTISEPNGSVSIKKTTMVTGKGQQYFVNLFLSNPEGAAI